MPGTLCSFYGESISIKRNATVCGKSALRDVIIIEFCTGGNKDIEQSRIAMVPSSDRCCFIASIF